MIQAAEAGAPIDALFLPGGQENLEIIARLMPQAEIDTDKVKVLGTGGMDYPNVGREAKLVGAWYAAPEPGGWNEFSQKYAKTYGSAPPRIASLAYDAVSLAIAVSGGGEESATTRPSSRARAASPASTAPSACCPMAAPTARSPSWRCRSSASASSMPRPASAPAPPPATSSLPRASLNLN